MTTSDRRPGERVRLCYLVQSHAHPHQIARLVRTLRAADPGCVVHLSHDRKGCEVPGEVRDDPGVHVSLDVGGRGRFHNVQRWLDAAAWLQDNVEVDAVVTLTAQDYPVRPAADLHAALAASGDGLMEHFPVLRPGGNWPLREGRSRYQYSWHDLRPLSPVAKARLRPLLVVNRVQPVVRVNVAFDGLRVGLLSRSRPFGPDTCWGGAMFTNLSWRAVEHVLHVSRTRPDVMAWARRSLLIEEAFFQSVLVSSGRFRFVNSSGRFYDWSQARQGSPATLSAADVPRALASGEFFARKWSPSEDPAVFDALDKAVGLG